MLYRITLIFGCLFFLILLLITYNIKKPKESLRSDLFKYVCLNVILLIISDILTSMFSYEYSNELLNSIGSKTYYICGILCFTFLYYYSVVLLNNLEYKNILELLKKNIRCLIMTILSFAAIICMIIFSINDNFNSTYFLGLGCYIANAYYLIVLVFVILEIFISKNKIKLYNNVLISIVLIVLILFVPHIYFYKYISIIAVAPTLEIFIFYFLIENPDLFLIKEIDELKASTLRSSKAKSDFLSNMSHEIRSPMNAIIGFSESILADDEFNSEKVLNDISHIKSSSKTLLEIINNILDISKIEAGNDTLNEKEYSLYNHIVDWTGIVETRIENRNIKFFLDIEEDLPSKLYGDATKVYQVVLNLLTNAIKYTEIGRIKLKITKEYINNDTVNLLFVVSDTGFGIREEDKEKVFQKFSRLDTATTNEIEGTGLGLVLTKKYAELMGGNLWFDSEDKVGSTFYFEVNQKVIDKKPIKDMTGNIDEIVNRKLIDCSGKKVLLVDEDELNLKVTTRLLKAYNFDIECLTDPDVCIYNIKSGVKYDLIFLDHVMAKMTGIELEKALKALTTYNIPPIVMLTANAIAGVKEMYLSEGFDEYLSKPIDINELDKIVNKYFGNK